MFFLVPNFLSLRTEKKIAKILIRNGITVSVAESCTGGLISSRLTDVSGSSVYVKENFVTYADEAKIEYLDVKKETIEKYGVVSEEVAKEMAEGLLDRTGADIAIATTGIAGPTGATATKPVGLMWFAIANKYKSKTYHFYANKRLARRIIKFIFCEVTLRHLYKFLKKNYLKEE